MGELSLFAGIVGSDGHLSKDNSTICVINKDKDFLDSTVYPLICKLTGKKPSVRLISSGFGKKKYLVRVSSARLLKKLTDKYNIPIGAKSLTICPPKLSKFEEKTDYLRGWICGDGSVTIDRTRAKIEIWSKSAPMINWFQQVTDQKGIETRIFFEKTKKEHILRIGKKDSMRRFLENVHIPHPRKQKRLESLMNNSS